ncbi:MAG: sugar phosphate isomerase/epimerase [Anaerolineaceae bacterium]|nr:sugar phosphate isomerase/epimerase [Anaerolineaceae bacterium]
MNNPVNSIRIGTLIGGHAKLGDYIRQIADYGFESFQINFWSSIPEDVDLPKLADDVFEAIGDRDIVIGALGLYGNPLKDDQEGEFGRRDWKRLIDAAELFKTDIVAGFTGRVPGKSAGENMPRFTEVWSPLVEQASNKNIRIAFENCPMGGDWEDGSYNLAFNPSAWELIFDALPSENLGLEWEPCHQMVQLIDPLPQLRDWAHKIFHMHGKCASIDWDIIRRFGISSPKQFAYHRTPGFGDLNWTDVISILRMGGFEGSIDIEGWHDPVYRDDLEMTGQVHSLNYLKNCRGGAYIPNPEI